MFNLGDYKAGATIDFKWHTTNKAGASANPTTAGTLSVYKSNSTTQTTTGVTDTRAFDSLTGVHHCRIALTDAFYVTSEDYEVVLSGAVIDGETVNAVIASFSIEKKVADIVKINGGKTDGYNAILKLKELDIWATDESPLKLRTTSAAGSYPAIYAKGVGNGNGATLEGAGTGRGLECKAPGGGEGLLAFSASGIGLLASGGTKGLFGAGGTGGAVFECTNQGKGLNVLGGPAGGDAVTFEVQYSGDAIESSGLNIGGRNYGIRVVVQKLTGNAILVASQDGSTVKMLSNANYRNLDAKEIGAVFNIDGVTAAGILDVLKKVVDDNGGADFDAATDSLNKISDSVSVIGTNVDDVETGLGVINGKVDIIDTNVDEIESIVNNIQNNTRCVVGLPSHFNIPETSFTVYKIVVNLYNTEGGMEDPDNQEFAINVETAQAISKSGLLYKELACTNLLDVAPSFPAGYKKLVRVGDNGDGTGQYYCYIKIASTETPAELVYDFACYENGGYPLHFARSNNMDTIPETGDVTLEDNVTNKQIIAGSLRSEDVSAIPVVEGSILKDLQTQMAGIPADMLAETVDGISVEMILELTMAMVDGRILKDSPQPGDLTFYKRDNSTILTITRTTASQRTRIGIL